MAERLWLTSAAAYLGLYQWRSRLVAYFLLKIQAGKDGGHNLLHESSQQSLAQSPKQTHDLGGGY